MLKYAGILAAAVVLAVVVLKVTKLHQNLRFLATIAATVWLFSSFSTVNDFVILVNMVQTIFSETADCSFVNTRSVFLTFLPYPDHFQLPGCPPFYYSSSDIAVFRNKTYDNINGPGRWTTCTNGVNARVEAPPGSQSFQDYANPAFVTWASFANQPTDALPRDVAAFAQLCQRFQRCRFDPLSMTCVNAFDEHILQTKSHYAFAVAVLAYLGIKATIELFKMFIIVVFARRKANIWPGAINFIRGSPLLLLYYPCGMDPFDVLLHQNTYRDYLWQIIYSIIPIQLPMLGFNLRYVTDILQTGVTVWAYFSVFSGLLVIPVTLIQAVRSWRQAVAADRIALLTTELAQVTENMVDAHGTAKPDDEGYVLIT
jgi:hypothetical protein